MNENPKMDAAVVAALNDLTCTGEKRLRLLSKWTVGVLGQMRSFVATKVRESWEFDRRVREQQDQVRAKVYDYHRYRNL